jgi:hypothetical protein
MVPRGVGDGAGADGAPHRRRDGPDSCPLWYRRVTAPGPGHALHIDRTRQIQNTDYAARSTGWVKDGG